MKIRMLLAASVAFLVLSGCGNLNSIYRPLEPGQGALVDIKQRAIIVAKDGRICVEPSPDATAAYAIDAAAKLNKAPAELALSTKEAAAYNGLRTSAIVLLRDQLLGKCLDAANGDLLPGDHDLLARRFQKQAVAMHAIEQLTGAVSTPVIFLTTTGNAAVASADLAALNKQAGEIETEISGNLVKIAAASDDQVKKQLEEKNKLLADRRSGLLKAATAPQGVTTTGSTSGAVAEATAREVSIEKVADAVRDIAKTYMEADDAPQLCFKVLADPKRAPALEKFCTTLLNEIAEAHGLATRIIEAQAELIANSSGSAEEKAKVLGELLSGLKPGIAVRSHRRKTSE